jgi:hypothetical protein
MKTHDSRPVEPEEGMVVAALEKGAAKSLRIAQAQRNPVPTMVDGKVVWIPPEEIVVDEPPKNPAAVR